jgi:DNA (cytosine-5)-methyltransferase 1
MGSLFLPNVAIKQSFSRRGTGVSRSFSTGLGKYMCRMENTLRPDVEPGRDWAISYLRGAPAKHPATVRTLTLVDLFCGAGGLTFGMFEAARSLGIELRPRVALDLDEEALALYQRNMGVDAALKRDVQRLIDYKVSGSGLEANLAYKPTILEPLVHDLAWQADLVVAGPPCQGHSNLNNRTRRDDRRNLLYLTAPAFAVACRASAVVIENVPDVLNDKHNVVATARALLVKNGYSISEAVLSAHRFGIPQTRRRHFLVAVRDAGIEFNLTELVAELETPSISVGQAIEDLMGKEGSTPFHSASRLSLENQKRIDWLFDQDKDDLPDHIRPVCHQDGHSYPAVYGRLRWDQPSGTITTGFMTPGRGRYIHPKERRGLTPHEAARIQGFPDSFVFADEGVEISKKRLSKVIGDAVPPSLGHAIGIATLALIMSR